MYLIVLDRYMDGNPMAMTNEVINNDDEAQAGAGSGE